MLRFSRMRPVDVQVWVEILGATLRLIQNMAARLESANRLGKVSGA